jgi:hypothetical protein
MRKIEEFDTFGDVIDAWVAEKRAIEDAKEREPKFYASDFGCCHKRMILKRAGVVGRPIGIDSQRNLEERKLFHDERVKQLFSKGALIAADSGTPYVRAAAPTRLSDGMPEGFGCRADGIGHLRCHCGHPPFPITVHWGKMARHWGLPGRERIAANGKLGLSRHKLELVEVKTAHANLMNYASTLPRSHNVLQVRTGAWAARKLYGLDLTPYLVYFAVGSGARPLEFACGGGPEDDYADVEREISTLQQEWAEYQTAGVLPDRKPLDTKVGKEKTHRVVSLVDPWECNALYCPYCVVTDRVFDKAARTVTNVRDGQGCCMPNLTEQITGTRLGYEEDDGSITYVRKWIDKVPGYASLGFSQIIDDPRPGSKEEG